LEQSRSGDQFTADLANYYSNIIPKFKPVIANARRYMRTGYSSFEKSKFKEAINQYNQAKLQYERAHDTAGQAFVEYRIAHCYVLLTDLTRARLAFSRLLIDVEAKRYRWLAAQCLFGLGHASVDEDEFSKAIDYSEQALTRFEKIGDANGIIRSLIQLADFNQAMNLIGKSLGYLIRAWALVDMTHSQLAQRWGILNQIGFSMSSLQFNAAALFYQKEALDLALKFGNRLLASRSYGYVGSAYAALKMYPEALKVATEAFDIGANASNEIEGREIMANASLRLGDVHREAGKCDQAIPNYDRSLALYRGLKTENYSYEAHKGKLKCFIAASDKKAVRKELGVVLRLSELYRSKINSENQRNSFFDAEQGVYDLAIAYESGIEGNYEKAFEYSERSRARSLLDAVLSGAKLRKKQGEIDIKLPVVTSSLSASEIKNRMPARTLLIEYAVLEDRLVIWVVTPTKLEHKVVPITADDLTAKVRIFLDAVNHSKSSPESYRQTATELYDILIGPIESFLEDSKTIFVVADKILNYLPYAALVSPKNRYLIEDYDLGVASSGSLFVNQSAVAQRYSKTGDENLLVAGDPKFNRGTFASLRELPSSALECNEISRLYPNHQRLVRDDATEENIKVAMESADVVHFAMHFVVNERSEMLSGFPLTPSPSSNAEGSDGFLQSYEIYGLKLRRVRLAVLSACQTGIERQYQGEGAIGAARPFFVAGVPTVIASLWPVDSDASAELMVNFHKHRRESVSATRALKRAQLDMIQGVKIEFRHPYYWAPFLAIGGVSN
jgi:CHAT domain-containing protein